MTDDGVQFWGRIASGATAGDTRRYGGCTPSSAWQYQSHPFSIAVAGRHAQTMAAWGRDDNPTSPWVFVVGSLYLGTDGSYGESTKVEPLDEKAVPGVISRLFDRYGTQAFALLDGDYSLVLFDPKSKDTFLVVDKMGCSDIYVREQGESMLFASQPSYLMDDTEQFDPLSVAFLLAHEGFIPAPFTLSPHVKAIGRATCAQVSICEGRLKSSFRSYWKPEACWNLPSAEIARKKLLSQLQDSITIRMGSRTSVLLSGGIDSSLVVQLAAKDRRPGVVALTGSVKGWPQGEREIADAKRMSGELGIRHKAVILDPHDESLPDESLRCTVSWMNGVRLFLPLWRRFALNLRDELGAGYHVLAGQTADTLADNNYTVPSAGYAVRRALFSSWFLDLMPSIRFFCPRTDGIVGKLAVNCVNSLAGSRAAEMLKSILVGMTAPETFYAGRLFGYGEMPGVSRAYFPMLTQEGFERVVNWYCVHFLKPLILKLASRNFYRRMIELSMDMNMLHLDSRLLFHVYRQEGGRAQLPFMDARLVTFFSSLPYSARAIYREPKYVISSQLRKQAITPPRTRERNSRNSHPSKSQEQILLEGTLGAFYRDLLRGPTVLNRVPRLFEYLDESYCSSQLARFQQGRDGIDYAFIAKIGTLELWNRALSPEFEAPAGRLTSREG